MKNLTMKLMFCPVAGLINMPWLNGIKARHEQQKEANYLKNKPFLKSSKYFCNACKILLEENTISRSSRPELLFKKVFLEDSTKFIGKHQCRRLFSNQLAS